MIATLRPFKEFLLIKKALAQLDTAKDTGNGKDVVGTEAH